MERLKIDFADPDREVSGPSALQHKVEHVKNTYIAFKSLIRYETRLAVCGSVYKQCYCGEISQLHVVLCFSSVTVVKLTSF